MASPTSTPFRFRDLPGESTVTVEHSALFTTPIAEHQVETAILRTSKETYREAYDVMVKANRFVKITSSQGLPMRFALAGQAVRMIAIDKDIVDRFKGYVLGVHIDFKRPRETPNFSDPDNLRPPVTAMILSSDLDRFCNALKDGDLHDKRFSEKIEISITMAPVLVTAPGNTLSPKFDDFFTKKTQESLFMPFMTNLFGYKAVEIGGHVDSALAATVREDIAQDRYSNPAVVLAEFAAAKDRGSQQFKDRQYDEACIVRKGGDAFVSEIAPLYFLMQLNIAHIQIANMQKMAFGAEILAEGALNSAVRSMKPGFWKPDYKFRPSIQQSAKLRYRYAIYMRLEGNPENANRVLSYIDSALELQPGDAALTRERENILAWRQQL